MTEKKFGYLKVGDTVWVTLSRFRSSDKESIEEAVVTKVGRKYVSIRSADKWESDRGQFEIEDGYEKTDYGTKRFLVENPEVYYAERRRRSVYENFKRHFGGWSCPLHASVTTEDILAAAALMKINLKKD